jgi:hypothetical protein
VAAKWKRIRTSLWPAAAARSAISVRAPMRLTVVKRLTFCQVVPPSRLRSTSAVLLTE